MTDADINAVIEEKNRVVRENWKLRAALRPFADIYEKGSHDPSDPEHCLRMLADSRRAAELLSAPE